MTGNNGCLSSSTCFERNENFMPPRPTSTSPWAYYQSILYSGTILGPVLSRNVAKNAPYLLEISDRRLAELGMPYAAVPISISWGFNLQSVARAHANAIVTASTVHAIPSRDIGTRNKRNAGVRRNATAIKAWIILPSVSRASNE